MRTGKFRKCLVILMLLGLTAAPLGVMAIPITGEIGFGGVANPTGGAGLGDATGINFVTAFVLGGTGDYAGIPAFTGASFTDFTFNPLDPLLVSPLWAVSSGGIDYSFDLASISIVFQDADQLNLSGSGMLSATGFDDTNGAWILSSNGGGDIVFTFSSITGAVPEPSTLMLLGLGVLGLAAARRTRITTIH